MALENTVAVQLPHPWFNLYLYRGVPIVFGLALLFFGWIRLRGFAWVRVPLQQKPLAVHFAVLMALSLLEIVLLRTGSFEAASARLEVACWLSLFPVLVASLLLSFVPWTQLRALARELGPAWAYAAVTSALVVFLRERFRLDWGSSGSRLGSAVLNATFSASRHLLSFLYPAVLEDRATHTLGTPRFLVIIGGTCSGVEGLALMSAFCAAWLVFSRRELRIERAFLLVPLALLLIWLLNVVRLVALIAIGDAGHPTAAIEGFHSEAGWIAFNLVSLGFLVLAQQINWVRKRPVAPPPLATASGLPMPGQQAVRNVPAIYLAPFLAVTAASVISHTASAGFEWLYPVRFVAALLILWAYRREYRRMDWRFGGLGVGAGLGVAVFWLACHALLRHFQPGPAGVEETSAALGLLPAWQRDSWVAIRVLAAVLTVPLAEELAFRGYGARRWMDRQVETISYTRLTLPAILVSSVAFGLVHGRMWLPGIVAGGVYAAVAKRRDRLGEAVAAHATTNLVIAVAALVLHDYTLW